MQTVIQAYERPEELYASLCWIRSLYDLMVLIWRFVAIAKLSNASVDWMQVDVWFCAALMLGINPNS